MSRCSIQPALPPRVQSPRDGCNTKVIVTVALAIILINVTLFLRYGLDTPIPFLSQKILSTIEISHVIMITIGAIALLNIGRLLRKSCAGENAQPPSANSKRTCKPVLYSISKDSQVFKPAPQRPPTFNPTRQRNRPPGRRGMVGDQKDSQPPGTASASNAGPARFFAKHIITNEMVSVESTDRAGSGRDLNCVFDAILTAKWFENQEAASKEPSGAPLPWDPAEHFPPGVTFATATYQQYQDAAANLRTKFGMQDLAEWESGFADTFDEERLVPGFYTKWSQITQMIHRCEEYLPLPTPILPQDPANRQSYQIALANAQQSQKKFYEQQLYQTNLDTLLAKIHELRTLIINLDKWDDIQGYRNDQPSLWQVFDTNQARWFSKEKETFRLTDARCAEDFCQFITDLRESLTPLTEGRGGLAMPLLYQKHFVGLNDEDLFYKNRWFTSLTQVLVENIGIRDGIEAPEVGNDARRVARGEVHASTFIKMLNAQNKSGNAMTDFAFLRADMLFRKKGNPREFVILQPNFPPHIMPRFDYNQDAKRVFFLNYKFHWTCVKRESGDQLLILANVKIQVIE